MGTEGERKKLAYRPSSGIIIITDRGDEYRLSEKPKEEGRIVAMLNSNEGETIGRYRPGYARDPWTGELYRVSRRKCEL